MGSKGIAAALKNNSSLQTLNLRDNEIGDEGAKGIAAALKSNSFLKILI